MKKTIHLAGGCFWGVEKYMARVCGVLETEVGFANGDLPNPTYEQVYTGTTGHAETVRIVYDSTKTDLSQILEKFYRAIDPTAINQQGDDIGTHYRTGIYFTDPADEPIIRQSLAALATKHTAPIATEIAPLAAYYPAEEYHQKYLEKNPDGYCHIDCEILD